MSEIKKGKSICLFSAKGGVGKTTTALNLAGIYQSIEKKVLIIDLDLFNGGVSVALNLPSSKTIYNLFEDLNSNNYTTYKDYVASYSDYIDVLAAPRDPREVNKIDSRYIGLILEHAMHLYDIVIIDTTHVLDEVNIIALDKADQILFVVVNDPLNLKNMKTVISIFSDLEINNYKVLLNNSRDPYKNYFSLYDIKNILKVNVDYTLNSEFFIKNIDNYVMNGKIITLEPKMATVFAKDYGVLMRIALDFCEKTKEGELGNNVKTS